MKYGLRLLVCLGFATVPQLLPPASSLGETGSAITIRVINSKTGKPLKNINIVLEDSAGNFLKDDKGKVVAGTTNKLGEVFLYLPSPVPERLGVFYTGGNTCELGQCPQIFTTAEILKTGIIGSTCSVPKHTYNVSPRPGELVIFGTPFSWWQCVLLEMP